MLEKKIYLHSPIHSKFGKTNLDNLSLSLETAEKSLKEFDKEKIDLLIFTSFAPERFTNEFHIATKLANKLNLKNVFAIRSETASSSGASAIHLASEILQGSRFTNALVVGTEVMSKLSREESNLVLGSVLSNEMQKFFMSMAQGAGMITNLYFKKFGYTKKDLFYVAKKLHENGSQNPNAHIQKKINFEDYENAQIFSSPLGLYDISPLSDGSSAIILSKTEKSSFQIKGLGHGINDVDSLNLNTSFMASKKAFKDAYETANVKPENIQIAELHDAFTSFELIGAEDANLFPEGTALKNVMDGVTEINGDLPINPSGGLKTRGHPIAASGIAQIVEIIRFMKDKKLSLGLCHSIGGLATNNFATIIEQL
jgi:acetyl-CoA acetyltransferase